MKPPDPVDADDDDAAWLEALAGRPPAGADRATLAEAAGLRRGHQRFAARPEGLEEGVSLPPLRLPPRPCALCQRLRAAWQGLPRAGRWPGLALAALALVFVAPALLRQWQPAPQDEALRGAALVQLLSDPAPQLRRERIAELLQAQGVIVHRYERFGRAGLDAQLDPAQRATLLEALAREGLVVDLSGALSVEIVTQEPRP